MNDQLTAQGIRFREFLPTDIPASVEIANRIYPDDPNTVENEEYFESIYPPENPRLRYAIENSDGKFIGQGACLLPFWQHSPGVYMMWIMLDAEWRRRGIGRSLLAEFETYARKQGVEKLRTDCREDQAYSIEFLKAMGFSNFGVRYESELDLKTFDESRFGNVVDQAMAAGYEFTTLTAERAIELNADRLLYDVDRITRLDVPMPGGTLSKSTYENFRRINLESPDSDPSAIFIAKHNGQYVGLTMAWMGKDKPAYTAMTGVLREHRQYKLALALKLISFRLMKERGYTAARTTNDTANPAILGLNEKLGYKKLPGNSLWEKVL
jgi:ribosomal protein S18 acetylase RimI-like enzyme